jgi:glycosyltransferase involved in cell wall biosynthesis
MSCVSVIIPAYNAGRFLAQAIDSILAQTRMPDEVIVINDGSTDNTLAVAQAYAPRVSVLSQPNGGISVARNAGVAASTGTLLAFQDADDVADPQRLALQVAAFEADPALDLVFAHIIQFRGSVTEPQQPGCIPGMAMVRRSAFDRVGPFDKDVKLAEFLDWYARAREQGLNERMLPEVLLRRRLHDDNIGVRDVHLQGNYARILKASLDRRRAATAGAPPA